MRINVYSQELLTHVDEDGLFSNEKVELEKKESNTGIVYSAVRMFLDSPDSLHSPPDNDDDRSAITWWLPKSDARREEVARTFDKLAALVRMAPPETGLD